LHHQALLIFPHQLFTNHPDLHKDVPIYLIEEFLFFTQYPFHKQKLTFHRASMKAYQHFLQSKKYDIVYIEATEALADIRTLLPYLKSQGISTLHYSEVTDNFLEKRIAQQAQELAITLKKYKSELFILTEGQVKEYFLHKERFHQTDFYIKQRKQFKVLTDEKLQPIGGKWTFDTENRLKYPKGKIPPATTFPESTEYWKEASFYIEKNFPSNYGVINHSFIYPTTVNESRTWLQQFLRHRFAGFGDYEDAIVKKETLLHHSLLAPLLNAGLLTPKEVLEQVLAYANEHTVPLNSTEGLVRQLLGWREFIRGIYDHKGSLQRTANYWKFKRKIPNSFWTGTTGIVPIDVTIKKVLATGYCHHIERLMVLGNFMLLCEFDPDEVYRWFMELFIDAYDWVMVPNVYGMSQFADGGLMATKPYISGSNYLMKMSDYEKGDWQLIWDGLFWRFMHVHRDFFLKNPRLGMLIKTFDKMPIEKQQQHLQRAEDFLKQLDESLQ
jgi:deoxyribodipyrimidine photolyase-related protein